MKDEDFIRTKVPMTKEEVRVLTIDRLRLENAKTFIDVGAGTGSIGIEASLKYPQLQTIAIERNPEALELIGLNCEKFGVNNLKIVDGHAPVELPNTKADAIFIGGSGGSLKDIIDWSHDLLLPNGRLVLNFILMNNLMEALSLIDDVRFTDIETTELLVSKLTKLGSGHYFKPNNPTFIISCQKRGE